MLNGFDIFEITEHYVPVFPAVRNHDNLLRWDVSVSGEKLPQLERLIGLQRMSLILKPFPPRFSHVLYQHLLVATFYR